jgi:hypothetical protein
MSQGKDYILQIKVQNGPLLRIMRMRGYRTATALSKASGVQPNTIGAFLRMRELPIKSSRGSKWKESTVKLAKFLRVPPESMFPEQHLTEVLQKGSGEMEVSREEMVAICSPETSPPPEVLMDRTKMLEELDRLIDLLGPRSADLLCRYYGLRGYEAMTFREIGEVFGLSGSRTQQIINRLLRRMRHPAHSIRLRQLLHGDESFPQPELIKEVKS